MSFTRAYFSFGNAAAVSPTFGGGGTAWGQTTGALRKRMDFSRQNTSTNVCTPTQDGTANKTYLVYQLVSGGLAAQTISGSLKGQFLTFETIATGDVRSIMKAYIVDSAGTTVRGMLFDLDANALSSEWVNGTLTNRKMPLAALSPMALTPVVCSLDDRIVLEIGGKAHGTGGTNLRIALTDNQSGDLPEDETTTTQTFNSWVEFSNTIYVSGETPPDAGSSFDPVGMSGFFGQ